LPKPLWLVAVKFYNNFWYLSPDKLDGIQAIIVVGKDYKVGGSGWKF